MRARLKGVEGQKARLESEGIKYPKKAKNTEERITTNRRWSFRHFNPVTTGIVVKAKGGPQ
jgi:hypothetical protein